MDTTATDAAGTAGPGVFAELRGDGTPLVDPTLVLLRIENNGATYIDEVDYLVPHVKKAGVRVTFPDRTVVGMVVTEFSHWSMRTSFEGHSGLAYKDNVIELPKVPMNRGA